MASKNSNAQDEDAFRSWWERTFREREVVLHDRFGPTEPPGVVTAFSWSDINLIIPGACALCFPPEALGRPHWLCLSHGLTQPDEPQPPVPGQWSGYGCEFGIATREKSPWATEILYQLLTYWKSEGLPIGPGARVPLAFFGQDSPSTIQPRLGMIEGDEPTPPIGEMRALLFWQYRCQPKPLWTSTGYFDLVIATTITQEEWDFAKETSSAHLMLLLERAGIGQLSDLHRSSLTSDPRWQAELETVRSLAEEQALNLLNAMP